MHPIFWLSIDEYHNMRHFVSIKFLFFFYFFKKRNRLKDYQNYLDSQQHFLQHLQGHLLQAQLSGPHVQPWFDLHPSQHKHSSFASQHPSLQHGSPGIFGGKHCKSNNFCMSTTPAGFLIYRLTHYFPIAMLFHISPCVLHILQASYWLQPKSHFSLFT